MDLETQVPGFFCFPRLEKQEFMLIRPIHALSLIPIVIVAPCTNSEFEYSTLRLRKSLESFYLSFLPGVKDRSRGRSRSFVVGVGFGQPESFHLSMLIVDKTLLPFFRVLLWYGPCLNLEKDQLSLGRQGSRGNSRVLDSSGDDLRKDFMFGSCSDISSPSLGFHREG
ncbi:hypothetical protein YC2023_010506 [Brassica napus]